MKKLSLLFFMLFISFSFGQTKKKETTTQPSPNDNLRIVEIKSDKYEDTDLTVNPLTLPQAVINEDENMIYSSAGIEVKPEFPGGIDKFFAFVAKNYQMPDEESLSGKVWVSFVVEKDGSLTDIKVMRDIGYGTGKEAVRVLKSSPKWNPAEQNGKKVRCSYALPISLPLQIVNDNPVASTYSVSQPLGTGQDDNAVHNSKGVEVRPEFPGGMQKFYEFVGKKYKMPKEKGLKGKVYVSFVVERDGSLTDIKVLRDIGYGTGAEAVRVLKSSPKWSPGEQNGKKVRCSYTLPIAISN